MIKLQDFAVQQGVTDRQVQRLLKKYEAELNGLYQRKGPNGTWLTEEACEILRSKMRQAPIVLVDGQSQSDLAEAKAKIENLLEEKDDQAKKLIALYEWKAEKAQLIAEAEQTRLLLDATKQEKTILEGFIQDAKDEIAVLSDEKAKAEGKAKEADERAQKAQDELTVAHERERLLKEYAAALDAWSALGWLKRKRTPKPAMPELPKED